MNSEWYINRRKQLIKVTENRDGYAVAAFTAMQQTNDSAAEYVQEASFLYLTGITEPDWLLLMRTYGQGEERAGAEHILVAPNRTEVSRIFDGGLSAEEAQRISGVDRVVTKEEGNALLEDILQESRHVGVIGPDPYEKYHTFAVNPAPKQLYRLVKRSAKESIDIRQALHRLRSHKSPEEVAAIRRAIDVTAEAFAAAKKSLKTATYEYEVEAEMTRVIRGAGLHHAYDPIIAAGSNACTLHYQENQMALPSNGLILMDVGARFDGYAADVTRTYAIGIPSSREKAVHSAVERAHRRIICLLGPGVEVAWYHQQVDEIMKDALEELRLLHKRDDQKTYRKYFPHAVSHGLGLDVHDALGASKVFEPGMVLTVEPGIYIPEEGIGVRIEDDILITADGYENVSESIPTGL